MRDVVPGGFAVQQQRIKDYCCISKNLCNFIKPPNNCHHQQTLMCKEIFTSACILPKLKMACCLPSYYVSEQDKIFTEVDFSCRKVNSFRKPHIELRLLFDFCHANPLSSAKACFRFSKVHIIEQRLRANRAWERKYRRAGVGSEGADKDANVR